MLSLNQLRVPTDDTLSRLDIAAVDLTCAGGLPGSENLDIPACLAWIDHAAAWVRHDTQGTLHEFARRPEEFDHSEGLFRVVSMVSVLQRGLKVRYNPARIGDLGPSADSRDDFIHGMIGGPGGTCASMPVLYVAVGRRLGYPLKLVTTVRHLFARWDDPAGERFNIEITNKGLNTFPDDYYRTWPVPIEETPMRRRPTRFLLSLSPREEVAHAWQKRGYCLHDSGRMGEAVDAFAVSWSLAPEDPLSEYLLTGILGQWRARLGLQATTSLPPPVIDHSRGRRYPGLHFAVEQEIISLEDIQRSRFAHKEVDSTVDALEPFIVNCSA